MNINIDFVIMFMPVPALRNVRFGITGAFLHNEIQWMRFIIVIVIMIMILL